MTIPNDATENQLNGKQLNGERWTPPSQAALQQSLERLNKKRPSTVTRTIIFKLHNPGRRKERALIWAQTQVTNMTAYFLDALRESPDYLRMDGAIACIVEMLSQQAQGVKGERVTILSDIISGCFLARSSQSKREKPYIEQIIIKNKPLSGREVGETRFPICGPLRQGSCRQVALMLLNWYIHIMSMSDKTEKNGTASLPTVRKRQPGNRSTHFDRQASPEVPSIEHIHAQWAVQWNQHEVAANTIIPFGRHRGRTLREAGKREVRWIRERLVPTQKINETLDHIKVCKQPHFYDEETQRKASFARHPWRRQPNLQRQPRAGRVVQRRFDIPAPLIRLGALSQDELNLLESELKEMCQFATEFDTIRTAVMTFLAPAPRRYPTVQSVLDDQQHDNVKQAFDKALDRLATHVLHVDRESETVTDLLQAESLLEKPDLQPLSYTRTMYPSGNMSSFALLFSVAEPTEEELRQKYRKMSKSQRQVRIDKVMNNRQVYTYVLAVVVHGKFAFTDSIVERFQPEIRPGLFYVNFPETLFKAPKGSSVMLFPLECGEDYHEEQFLRTIITRQRRRQHEKYHYMQSDESAQLNKNLLRRGQKEITLANSLPNCAVTSARIVNQQTPAGHLEFYVHLPIEMPNPSVTSMPNRVIGFHEHAAGYSYAILDFTGRTLKAGNLVIPPHVLPRDGEWHYSNNYVFEVAKAMIELAHPNPKGQGSGALIGIENTDYQKQSPDLSRKKNRRLFSRPAKKLADILKYKSVLAALPQAQRVYGVSRHRCSQCGTKRAQGAHDTNSLTIVCPGCGSGNLRCARCLQLREPAVEIGRDRNLLEIVDRLGIGARLDCPHCGTNPPPNRADAVRTLCCGQCGNNWQVYEPWFTCTACGHRQAAKVNTAIVVAQNILSQLIRSPNREQDRQLLVGDADPEDT